MCCCKLERSWRQRLLGNANRLAERRGRRCARSAAHCDDRELIEAWIVRRPRLVALLLAALIPRAHAAGA
eukprot:4567503-Prymnesium_polylepis.1